MRGRAASCVHSLFVPWGLSVFMETHIYIEFRLLWNIMYKHRIDLSIPACSSDINIPMTCSRREDMRWGKVKKWEDPYAPCLIFIDHIVDWIWCHFPLQFSIGWDWQKSSNKSNMVETDITGCAERTELHLLCVMFQQFIASIPTPNQSSAGKKI